MASARSPRRLSKDARREQLVAVALPIVAEQGFAELSLEDIAAGADVTRNLLYHYFPRGRHDVVLATVREAGRRLTEDWLIDASLPLDDRIAANLDRMAEHALGPSDAWRVHRRARAADLPELDEIVDGYLERVIASMALNHFGTEQPRPFERLALNAYLAFGESALDSARASGAPPGRVAQLLRDTLLATVQSTNRQIDDS